MCAGTACFAWVTAGRTGHLGLGWARGVAPSRDMVSPVGHPPSCRARQEGRGSPCPSPSPFRYSFLFCFLIPLPDLQPLALWPGAGQNAARGQRAGQTQPGAEARTGTFLEHWGRGNQKTLSSPTVLRASLLPDLA